MTDENETEGRKLFPEEDEERLERLRRGLAIDTAPVVSFEELYNRAISSAREIDEMDDRIERVQDPDYLDLVGDVVEFFLWSNIHVEDQITHLFEFHMVDTVEPPKTEFHEYVRSGQLQFNQIREMVHKFGLIGAGLNGEIRRNRRIRSKVVHDKRKRVTLDIDELDTRNFESEVERAHNLFDKLQGVVLEYDKIAEG